MKKIPLTQGMVALVDDEDYAFINSFKWYAKESKKSWYAVRMKGYNKHSMRGCKKGARIQRKRKTIRMHNFIMKPGPAEVIHHKSGDGLDCQRNNMMLTDVSGNNQYVANKRKENQAVREEVPF